VWFSEYAPEGTPVPLYSAIYNGSYLTVEFLISAVLLYFIWQRDFLKLK